MELTKSEIKRLREFGGMPLDAPLTLDNLFECVVKKLEPTHRLPLQEWRHSQWLKIEFLYHGSGSHLDCYIRFSDRKAYYGAGCGLHWRPYENIHIALARALLQAIEGLELQKKEGKSEGQKETSGC